MHGNICAFTRHCVTLEDSSSADIQGSRQIRIDRVTEEKRIWCTLQVSQTKRRDFRGYRLTLELNNCNGQDWWLMSILMICSVLQFLAMALPGRQQCKQSDYQILLLLSSWSVRLLWLNTVIIIIIVSSSFLLLQKNINKTASRSKINKYNKKNVDDIIYIRQHITLFHHKHMMTCKEKLQQWTHNTGWPTTTYQGHLLSCSKSGTTVTRAM